MIVPILVGDRRQVLPRSPGVLKSLWSRKEPGQGPIPGVLLSGAPPHPRKPSGHCMECAFISHEFSWNCSAQHRERERSSSSQSLIEWPIPAISCKEPGPQSQRIWKGSHLSSQPILFPTAILVPTSMSPGLNSVYFECSVAF